MPGGSLSHEDRAKAGVGAIHEVPQCFKTEYIEYIMTVAATGTRNCQELRSQQIATTQQFSSMFSLGRLYS